MGVFFVGLVSATLSWPILTRAEEVATPTLLERIQEAKDSLDEVQVAVTTAKVKKGSRTSKKIQSRDIVLAVTFDPLEQIGTARIVLVHLKERGTSYISTSPQYRVIVPHGNGVNTNYQVFEQATGRAGTVLAGKYPVLVAGNLEQAVYTPYTKALHRTELVEAGRSYLEGVVAAAYANLLARQVRSRAFPSRLVVEIVPPELMQQLAVIEHLDPAAFAAASSLDRLLGQFFVLVGVNEQDAFAYTKSGAGAMGMMQFIPKTYSYIRQHYPEAQLTKDFIAGMRDHENAVVAAVLLADHNILQLSSAHRQYLLEHPDELGQYVAAAYNTGAGRVVKALAYRGENWQEDFSAVRQQKEQRQQTLKSQAKTLKSTIAKSKSKDRPPLKQKLAAVQHEQSQLSQELVNLKKGSLKKETVVYLKKLKAVAEGLRRDVS